MITSCARAEHHWQAANEGEISFAANDIVFVRNDRWVAPGACSGACSCHCPDRGLTLLFTRCAAQRTAGGRDGRTRCTACSRPTTSRCVRHSITYPYLHPGGQGLGLAGRRLHLSHLLLQVIAQVAEGERPVIDDISVDLLEVCRLSMPYALGGTPSEDEGSESIQYCSEPFMCIRPGV
jgi:hypothetical protein